MCEENISRRVSWIVTDLRYRMLVVRKSGTHVFFDPGCRVVEGEDERETLTRWIKENLGVTLHTEKMSKLTSFGVQAYGKPDDTIVEFACYQCDRTEGEITPHGYEAYWVHYGEAIPLSQGTEAVMEAVRTEGLI